jgi:GAF domain-containing protein
MAQTSKKTIGFIELPDEALDLFGHYARRPDWEVTVVVSIDGQSYAARMASILKIPLLDRPNRPALVMCDRLIVGKKPGLRATVQELLDDTKVEVVAVEDAMQELSLLASRSVPEPATAPKKTVAKKPAPAKAASPAGPSAAAAAPAAGAPTPAHPAPKRKAAPSAPVPAQPAPRRAAPAASGESRTFDAGTLLGADFRNKLQSLPLNDGDELLREILDLAVKVTHADSGSIMLVDETGKHLRIAVANGLPEWVVTHTRQEVGKGIAGTVFATSEPQIVHGHLSGPQATSADVRPSLREAACVPIPGKEGPIGVLNLNVESEGTRLDRSAIPLMKAFAREASGAILKAISLKRLSGTVQREVAIRQVERLMSLQENLTSRLVSVADVLGQSLTADFTHCLVTDAEGEMLELVETGKDTVQARRQPLDQGFPGWVLMQGAPCVLEAGSGTDRAALAYLPLWSGRPIAVFCFERIPLERTSAVEILQFLTETKEIVEALLALEEAAESIDTDFPPDRASA